MNKLLVTGFEPFGGESVNPSWECVKGLEDEICGFRVIKICLPVLWNEAGEAMSRLIDEFGPSAVLSFGQAGGRTGITVERIAVNLRGDGLKDGKGLLPPAKHIVPGGPDGIFTNLPADDMIEAARSEGIAVGGSLSAGAYICNEVMYTSLFRVKKDMPHMLAGFVHLPYMTGQQTGSPSMELGDMQRAAHAFCISICRELEKRCAS